jgi:hypothetical protein
MSGDGKRHDATDAICDLCFDYGCMHSLRLHPHAETEKKAINANEPHSRLVEIVSDYKRPPIPLLRLRSLLRFIQRSFPYLAGAVLSALLLKDSVGNLEVTMRWAMEAGDIASARKLLR